MDANRIEGLAREGVGRVERAWGGVTGDSGAQVRGALDQARGSTQTLYGEVKNRVRVALDRRKDEAIDLIERNPLRAVGLAVFVGLTLALLLNAGQSTRVVYVVER